MFSISMKAIGADRFRKMSDPKGAITKASWAFMRRQAEVYRKHAEALAPVGNDWSQDGGFNQQGHPGLLARSHVARVTNPFNAEVVNVAPYAPFVAGGTRPHMPPASSGLPWPVRRAIAEHGTKPQPWFDKAFAAGEAEVQANLDIMAEDILREMAL